MFLYLMRHGEASIPCPIKPSSLTPKGKSDVTRVAEHFIQRKTLKPDAIWHSPKTRAIQTAEIVWKVMDNPALPTREKELIYPPTGIQEQVHREILAYAGGNLLIVSHLPFLPDLAGLLLGWTGNQSLIFPTAGMAAFKRDKTFKLLWTLDPSSLK